MVQSILIAIALQAAPAAPGPASVLDLLEGEWICRVEWLAGGPVWRTETWRRDAEGRLTGLIHSGLSRAGGPAPAQEAELVISGRGRAMRLTYRPADGATVRYRLVRNERWEAVFESIGSGSPRIISYRSADGLRLDVMHGLET
jgi:hypothetical protein